MSYGKGEGRRGPAVAGARRAQPRGPSHLAVQGIRLLMAVAIPYLAFRFVLVDFVWSPLRWLSDLFSAGLGGLAVLALLSDPALRRSFWPARGGTNRLAWALVGAVGLAVLAVVASSVVNGRGLMDLATGIRSLVLWSTLLLGAATVEAWEAAHGPWTRGPERSRSRGAAAGAGSQGGGRNRNRAASRAQAGAATGWSAGAVGAPRRVAGEPTAEGVAALAGSSGAWMSSLWRWMIGLAVFMAAVEVAGVLLAGWFGPWKWVVTLTGSNVGRAVGLMKNPNTLGCFLVLGLILHWPRWATAVAERRRDWGAWGIAILLIVGLALTYSRQGWLALALALVAAGWLARRVIPLRVTAVLLAVTLVVTVIATVLPVPIWSVLARGGEGGAGATRGLQIERLRETFDEETVELSRASGRLAMVRYAMAMLRDHPVFGVGPGRVGGAGALRPDPEIRERYQMPDYAYADNQYVRTAMELGGLGLLGLGAIILSTLALAYRAVAFDWLLGAAGTAVVVAMVSFGLGQNSWENQPLASVYWLVLGAAWMLQRQRERA
ncbi:O-antigen ligase family protein [Thermaerobacter subterraneus]|uniref:Lipid A core-O-antigen ligase-like enyme n=1 Tax=Thermaerobacter subterraneus DSM 13965 TaxID=867903 RepID=K6NZ83_9FIRM|nr:O-antigen ligase family protein [Thermaerobacter subterraneus]EKP94180.1 lipid A core-O-antigen ligase-like enyme [Thermaerobacter subterraneus DSM 13965]